MIKKSKFLLCELLLIILVLTGCASGMENDAVESGDNDKTEQIEEEQNELPDRKSEGQEVTDNQDVAEQEVWLELSDEELDSFTDFVNSIENYGFLLSEYTDPTEVDLYEVFYCGAGISAHSLTDDELEAYGQATDWTIELDVEHLTTAQIDDFLIKKTGYSFKEMKEPFKWTYLEKYDAYIFQHGDTNYCSFICTEGKRTDEDIFEIHYSPQQEYGVNAGILILKRSGDDYIFVSNHYQTVETDVPDLSGLSEEIIAQLEVFAANKDVWNMNEYNPLIFNYAVYDINNDGKPELITSANAGTGLYSENHLYITDDIFSKIEELPQEYYEEYSELDIAGYYDGIAYMDGDVIFYPASDYTRNGAAESCCADGAYYLKDGIVYSVIFRSENTLWTDEDNSEQTWYDADGNVITQEEWENLYDDFYAGMEPITYHIFWNSIVPEELEQASEQEIFNALVENYKNGLE
ncbi:MAG: hypothetical protein K2N85_03200 [Lachnospiraceae bacterium]|nr:hypothetical protein [Lachnospiraceae bacterium]